MNEPFSEQGTSTLTHPKCGQLLERVHFYPTPIRVEGYWCWPCGRGITVVVMWHQMKKYGAWDF